MERDTRERTFGWQNQDAIVVAGLTRDGRDLLRAIGEGTPPLPPAMTTPALEPGEAEAGRVPLMLDPDELHLNPSGCTCTLRRP